MHAAPPRRASPACGSPANRPAYRRARAAAEVAASAAAAGAGGPAVAGALFSSYPFHPPGKPGQLRDEPLCSLQLPLLFLRGTSDPFSTPGPWVGVRARLASADVQVVEVEGGDHGLKARGGAAGQARADEQLSGALRAFLQRAAAAGGGRAPGSGVGAPGEAAEGAAAGRKARRGRGRGAGGEAAERSSGGRGRHKKGSRGKERGSSAEAPAAVAAAAKRARRGAPP
ncbi:MAG: hypothetical protein J3K34DRAFT_31399 [Monoraphidium minutum]|nr:MAG: hypothetical protein J3K34DRAFT_31399 [Monoraphidium minutum]